MQTIKIHHCPREVNQVADALADYAYDMEDVEVVSLVFKSFTRTRLVIFGLS